MAKKLPDPFTPHACERLRSLAKLSNDAEKNKMAATKSRDDLVEQINELNDNEEKRAMELKSACYDEERAIQKCNKVIKTCEAKMKATIEKGDDRELFETQASRLTLRTLFTEDEDMDEDMDDDDDADANADAAQQPELARG